MNEQKNNGRGVFYGVIGVATLVVAIIGATFAYFTATASNNTVITGNMATITFDLSVEKVTDVDDDKGGMIPMSNNMVTRAVEGTDTDNDGTKETCVDNNGNAVCQIYKITVTNKGSASLFLDGYVSLTGGSGVPTDWPTADLTATSDVTETNKWTNTPTTMRWAQAFCTGTEVDGNITGCSVQGKTTTGATGASTGANNVEGIDTNWAALGTTTAANANVADKATKTQQMAISHDVSNIMANNATVTTKGYISGNSYDIISKNYIRVSDHNSANAYKRGTDVSSALVFNQFLNAATTTEGDDTDLQVFYFVVWLSENGMNQTANDPAGTNTNADVPTTTLNFFSGNVTFNSAQGSEVTATFSGYSAVASDQNQTS